MLTLAIEFLAHRYHATSWDHHVNEGTVEWPPSQWRLARALVAASYKLVPPLPESVLRRVIGALLDPPHYVLPATTSAYASHYMPLDRKPGQVIDAFLVPAGGLEVQWPDVALGAGDTEALDRLVSAITYLGRAESWVHVERITASRAANCVPDLDGPIELWAAEQPESYAAWRARANASAWIPADWWEVLHMDTGRLYAGGWSRPPGTRRVRYRSMLESTGTTKIAVVRSRPTAARFELAATRLPRRTEALRVGECMRRALVRHGAGHPVFTGRAADGSVARGHGHAVFLPADDDRDGILDHVVVFAKDGFDGDAIRALEAVRRVGGHGGPPIDVVLIAVGSACDLGGTHERARAAHLAAARVWESHTPFVPTRHIKRRRGVLVETPLQQLDRLLTLHDLPSAQVMPLDGDWHQYIRTRASGGGRRGAATGYGYRLCFAQEVQGPIAIGYGAHQGLGQFVASEERR